MAHYESIRSTSLSVTEAEAALGTNFRPNKVAVKLEVLWVALEMAELMAQ